MLYLFEQFRKEFSYDPFFEPVIKVLLPNQANFYQVPARKNFILKSGIDATTPLTLNGFTISPFGSVMKAFAVPDGVQVKNLGNDRLAHGLVNLAGCAL